VSASLHASLGSLKGLTLRGPRLNSDAPPSEIRLFKAGINETTKGEFLFDSKAAELVIAAAKEQGIDLIVDLEHLSLDPEARHFNPDALGHFNLEVRNGELWAVNIRWNGEGERRLSEKTQRYISPAFMTDDDNRITEVVNIALVSMPATHNTPALVAANRRPKHMSLKDRMNALAARNSIAKGKLTKLADDAGGAAPAGKFAAAKSAADAAAQALADFEKASGGNDVDATFAAMEAAVKACDSFEQAVTAIAGGSGGEPVPDPAAASAQADQQQQMARKDAELVSLRKRLEQVEHDKKVEALAAEMDERRAICASFVTAGRMVPADVWADETASTPKSLFASMSIADLRTLAKSMGTAVKLGGPKAPTRHGEITGSGGVEISEYEQQRVKLYADKFKGQPGARSPEEAVERYVGHKTQQLRGAVTHDDIKRLGRRVEEGHVMLSARGTIVSLATAPVRPIEEFGTSSQRALEEFRMNYNMALASEPQVWAETIGDMLPGGSLKDTYPINFSANRYVEKTAEGPAEARSKNVDITVTKREFNSAEQVELRRLQHGDFAYIQSWGRFAERMARARVALRNLLVTALLEGGLSSYWGYDATLYPTGIDGQPFWSATHKVNPFDASMKLRASATWSNYQSAATPLNAVNLTAEKAAAVQVADPNGYEINADFDMILLPSVLNETAKNLLTIQDFILDARTVNGTANTMGPVKNPHYQSGMKFTKAPELTGAAATANYYLLATGAIARGLFPWVISEDAAEELRTFDESSDFFKKTGEIRVQSHIYTNAALLFPHAIRYVKGA
jgi:phage I-like protein